MVYINEYVGEVEQDDVGNRSDDDDDDDDDSDDPYSKKIWKKLAVIYEIRDNIKSIK